MAKRKALSKRTRFEVFKRDKFACQYCGRKAPDILLHVDHITPVAKGGTNEIVNLITSCFDCNSGKSDVKLSDDSAIQKQRNQLELLQEKREQMQLMMEWHKSLTNINEDAVEEVISYIEYFIEPHTINNTGKLSLKKLIKKYTLDEILDAIDTSATSYLKYDKNGDLASNSVETFFNKIGGILYTRNMTPLQQKLVYLKGIVKNRFGKDDKTAISILLNNYVNELRKHGYSDNDILNDLENELIPKTMELSWWKEWRDLLEGWTSSIQNWNKSVTHDEDEIKHKKSEPYTDEQIDSFVSFELGELEGCENALLYIGKAFPNFEGKLFIKKLREQYVSFLNEIESMTEDDMLKFKQKTVAEDFILDYVHNENLSEFFDYYDNEEVDYFMLGRLESCANDLLHEAFTTIFHSQGNMLYEDILKITQVLKLEIGKLSDEQK